MSRRRLPVTPATPSSSTPRAALLLAGCGLVLPLLTLLPACQGEGPTWGVTNWVATQQETVRPPPEQASRDLARLRVAIERYRRATGKVPGMLHELVSPPGHLRMEPILETLPLDPWGNAYGYVRLGAERYALRSAGPDGLFETDDDILR